MTDAFGEPATQTGPCRPVLRDMRFWQLMFCAAVSMVGEQFMLIALALITMALTPDPAALAWTFAALSAPRALLLLPGGSLVDRFGARALWTWGNLLSTLVLAMLCWFVFQGESTLYGVYLCALLLGACSALLLPSGSALLPCLVSPRDLERANGVMLSLRQLSMALGPAAAGTLMASAGLIGPATAANGQAVGLALSALCCTLAVVCLQGLHPRTRPATPLKPRLAPWKDFFLSNRRLRTYLAYMAAATLCTAGPVQVFLPLFSQASTAASAQDLGWLLGAQGAGTLAGMLAFAAMPRLRITHIGHTLLAVDALVALLLLALGSVQTVWQGIGLLLAMGFLGGFVEVLAFSWLQRTLPADLMGRGMSLFMLTFAGPAPLSCALAAGSLQVLPLHALPVAAGLMLLATVVWFKLCSCLGDLR